MYKYKGEIVSAGLDMFIVVEPKGMFEQIKSFCGTYQECQNYIKKMNQRYERINEKNKKEFAKNA